SWSPCTWPRWRELPWEARERSRPVPRVAVREGACRERTKPPRGPATHAPRREGRREAMDNRGALHQDDVDRQALPGRPPTRCSRPCRARGSSSLSPRSPPPAIPPSAAWRSPATDSVREGGNSGPHQGGVLDGDDLVLDATPQERVDAGRDARPERSEPVEGGAVDGDVHRA